MEVSMTRAMVILAGCLATAGCASTVATTVGFPTADADNDDMLTTAEFREFIDDSNAFENYDDNDDGMLSRMEYNEAVESTYETDDYFRGFDTDSNGSLNETEFIEGWFKQFDKNKDDRSAVLSHAFSSALPKISQNRYPQRYAWPDPHSVPGRLSPGLRSARLRPGEPTSARARFPGELRFGAAAGAGGRS
jgi:hypothetical protein